MYAPKYGSHIKSLLKKGPDQHTAHFQLAVVPGWLCTGTCQTGVTAFLCLRKLLQEQIHLWLPRHSESNEGSIST